MEASAPYMHRTVGLVERWRSVLKHLIMTHYRATYDERWHLYLPLFEMSFNTSINTSLGYSPSFVANLRHIRLPWDSLSSKDSLSKDEQNLPEWFK